MPGWSGCHMSGCEHIPQCTGSPCDVCASGVLGLCAPHSQTEPELLRSFDPGHSDKVLHLPFEINRTESNRKRNKQWGENDRKSIIPLGLFNKIEIKENQLGNIESFEESCNILIRRLPWQTSCPDYRVVVNKFHLAAADSSKTSGCMINARQPDLLPPQKTTGLFTLEVLFLWSSDRLVVLPNLLHNLKNYLGTVQSIL